MKTLRILLPLFAWVSIAHAGIEWGDLTVKGNLSFDGNLNSTLSNTELQLLNGLTGTLLTDTNTVTSTNKTFTSPILNGATLTGTIDGGTFTNSTLTAPAINGANLNFGTASNTNRILLPTDTTTNLDALTDTAGLLAYDTTQGKPVYNTGSGWTAVGSGSGGGGAKNYLGTVNSTNNNGDFETGALGSWTLGHTSVDSTSKLPTGSPTFGSGYLAAFGTDVVTPALSGTYSMQFFSSTATQAGDLIASPVFTVDSSEQLRTLMFAFNYEASANASGQVWSGTNTNTWGIALYDVTNSTWVTPSGAKDAGAGVWSMLQSTQTGWATGTFPVANNGSQFRLVIYIANATAGSAGVDFDDFFVGSQGNPRDAEFIGMQATSTFTGSITSSGTQVTSWTAQNSTAGLVSNAYIVPRTGWYRVSAKIPYATQAASTRANISLYKNGVSHKLGQEIPLSASFNISAQLVTVDKFTAGESLTIYGNATTTTAAVSGSQWEIELIGAAPALDEGSVIACQLGSSSAQVIASASTTQITGWSAATSAGGCDGWNTSGQYWLVPEQGWYEVKASYIFSAVATAGAGAIQTHIRVNGTGVVNDIVGAGPTTSAIRGGRGEGVIKVNAGDQISFAVYQDTGTSLTMSGTGHTATIKKVSGPRSVVASLTPRTQLKTSSYTALPSDDIILAENSSTITLPAATSSRPLTVCKTDNDTDVVTVSRAGSDVFTRSRTSVVLTHAGECVKFLPSGTNYWSLDEQTKTISVNVDTACSSSPCTIGTQTGDFTSCTRSGTGVYSCSYTSAAMFGSAAPACSVSRNDNAPNYCVLNGIGNSSVGVYCTTGGGVVDSRFSVVCSGPR